MEFIHCTNSRGLKFEYHLKELKKVEGDKNIWEVVKFCTFIYPLSFLKTFLIILVCEWDADAKHNKIYFFSKVKYLSIYPTLYKCCLPI